MSGTTLKKNQKAIAAAASKALWDLRPCMTRRETRSARSYGVGVVTGAESSHNPRVRSAAPSLFAVCVAAALALSAVACGGRHAASGPSGVIASFPDAGCPVEIDEEPLLDAPHVPIPSNINWNSNPPSSGPHYPYWAAYQAYTEPVPRGYYVHDLEHGAIVLLYNCATSSCTDTVAALQSVSDSLPDDPLCTQLGEGVRVRTVITPDPLIDVPVAAAAWGWVYKAQCVDLPTLKAFALDHYAHSPEDFCTNGIAQF
jgi:hypothetical protein